MQPLSPTTDARPHTAMPLHPPHPATFEPRRALAFVDVKTTGPDPERHEIIDVAVLRVEGRGLRVVAEHATCVAPERILDASAEALALTGYSRAGWEAAAVPLDRALREIAPVLEGAVLAGHNLHETWSFLERAYARCRRAPPHLAAHRLDVASLAWPLVAAGVLGASTLDALDGLLGIVRRHPYRALSDAHTMLAIARQLTEELVLGHRFHALPDRERKLGSEFLAQLERQTRGFGPWHVDDAFEISAASYARAERHAGSSTPPARRHRRRPHVYICHPFARDERASTAGLRGIAARLLAEGVLPVAPQLYLPAALGGDATRNLTRDVGLELLATCDEVRVFGETVTDEMEAELREARVLDLPVRFVREAFA